MPLPLLLVPIAVTVGSAAAQAVGKLRARKELNSLRAQLADAQARHRPTIYGSISSAANWVLNRPPGLNPCCRPSRTTKRKWLEGLCGEGEFRSNPPPP